jgi:hypothetical protein
MTLSPSHSDPNDSAGRKYETSDAHFRSVFVTGVVLLGIMVLGLVLSWGVYAIWNRHTAAPGTRAETMINPDLSKQPPGPNLQSDPRAALVRLRRAEDSILTSYAWVSRDSGFVRVPIERAIELLAKRGLPQQDLKVPR